MHTTLANKTEMQHLLFAELSGMFGKEVPLYDKSLLVNLEVNNIVCRLLAKIHRGFSITREQLDRTSGERHGAIRIGRPDEYRWIARFFAAFSMEPHNFYDMTNVGSKSQPIIATAFRSVHAPEHRVFTSLLQTNYFDVETRARIERLLATRNVFSDKAKVLIEKSERDGGLDWNDARELIREGTDRIFKWTGRARDHKLYKDLCAAGFKIAADIACFESHHLNHLTPNTFCMDLYTAAMKHCMGELNEAEFRSRATLALGRLSRQADRYYMRLSFRHLTLQQIEGFETAEITEAHVNELVDALCSRLHQSDLKLSDLKHSGFKDTTEGPSQDTPVLLRQDSYKALTEPVTFTESDGTTFETVHTARFGEIEQRFYATTKSGRELYDTCLEQAELAKDADPTLLSKDFAAYEAAYAKPFAAFPKTLPELLSSGLVLGRYSPTAKGRSQAGTLTITDPEELVRSGFARVEGLRYEDFLPVSAAGIFASNLNQYGTKSTAAEKPKYTQSMLEDIMGKKIIDSDVVYAAMRAQSLLYTYEVLGVLHLVPADRRSALSAAASACPDGYAAALSA